MNYDTNEISRQILNGEWSVSTLCMLVVLGFYLARQRNGWNNPGTRIAISLAVLSFGHEMRSTVSWFEFLYKGVDQNPGFWSDWRPFFIGTFFVLIGKGLCIYWLTPESIRICGHRVRHMRWWAVGMSGFFVFTIPVAFFTFFHWLYKA